MRNGREPRPRVARRNTSPAIHAIEAAIVPAVRPLEVSVIIPTYRRPQMLYRCLEALIRQDLAAGRFEIIVCDDGPDDATRELVCALAATFAGRGPAVRYLPVTATQGPAGARNAGWKAARADIIAFTDDDTLPDPGWLSAGVRAMTPAVAAAAGRIDVPLPRHPTDYERDVAGLNRAEFATANCFVRRPVLERLGGFDERYTAAWREDSDLQFSILKAGGRIAVAEEALVVHPVRPAPWGVSIFQQRKAQFEALLYKKHKALYRQRIAAGPRWNYYLIVIALLTAVAGLAFGAVPVALVATGAWLAMTAVFCVRRLLGTSHRLAHVLEMVWTSILIPPLSVYWRLLGALKYRVPFL